MLVQFPILYIYGTMCAMRNFKLIESAVDVLLLKEELKKNSDTWYINTLRQEKIKLHKHTLHIPLRSSVDERGVIYDIFPNFDDHEAADTKIASYFPETMLYLQKYAAHAHGSVGRAMYVALSPGKNVGEHVDLGKYFIMRDRYHLVIQSDEGLSGLRVEEEEVVMSEGELWCWNNKKLHAAFNRGVHLRVHLIFDIKPFKKEDYRFCSFVSEQYGIQ